MMRMLRGPNRIDREFYGVDPNKAMHIRGRKGSGVSLAVYDSDGDLLTYCSGSGRFGEDFPVRPDTLFQAASVSKPMFALTLLRYADKGLIDIDADISGVVPEYAKVPVSFADLLSHTAGFNLHGFPGYPADHAPLSLEDVLDGKGATPRLRRIRPAGKQFLYSGGGYVLAELAFTRITGTTLREAFQKEVAEPLGLTRTGFFQPLDEDLIANAAFGGRLAQKEDPARGYHTYPEHAAAGLWTTPTELVKIGVALSRSYRKGGFLKKKTARRMVTPVLDGYYGLGLFNFGACTDLFGKNAAGHDGNNEGFVSCWAFSLKEEVCVAGMFNRSDSASDWALTKLTAELFKRARE